MDGAVSVAASAHAPLLEIHQPGALPLTAAALGIQERCLHFLLGGRHLDERLEQFIDAKYSVAGAPPGLTPTQTAAAGALAGRLAAWPRQQTALLVRLEGVDPAEQWQIACGAVHDYAELRGQGQKSRPTWLLCRVPLHRLPSASEEMDALARLWRREAHLFNLALFISVGETQHGAESDGAAAVARLLEQTGCLAFSGALHASARASGRGRASFDAGRAVSAMAGIVRRRRPQTGAAARRAVPSECADDPANRRGRPRGCRARNRRADPVAGVLQGDAPARGRSRPAHRRQGDVGRSGVARAPHAAVAAPDGPGALPLARPRRMGSTAPG